MGSRPFNRLTLGLATAAALSLPCDAGAAEIRVLCSNGFKAVMQALIPQFEQATKHKVLITYNVSAELKRRIDAGEAFDIAVLTPALIDDAIRQDRIAGNTRTTLAQSPMAIAIRAGAPKPDIRTTDAFKRTLLSSTSIAYAREGAAGVFFADLMQRLGLADSLRSTIRLTTTGDDVSASVVRGDAELGVLPLSEILAVRGLDVLGTFPADLQGYVTMVAGVSASSAERQAADMLIRFLTAPASLVVLKQKGMERR